MSAEPHEISARRPRNGRGQWRAYCTCGYQTQLHTYQSDAWRSASNHAAAKTREAIDAAQTGT